MKSITSAEQFYCQLITIDGDFSYFKCINAQTELFAYKCTVVVVDGKETYKMDCDFTRFGKFSNQSFTSTLDLIQLGYDYGI